MDDILDKVTGHVVGDAAVPNGIDDTNGHVNGNVNGNDSGHTNSIGSGSGYTNGIDDTNGQVNGNVNGNDSGHTNSIGSGSGYTNGIDSGYTNGTGKNSGNDADGEHEDAGSENVYLDYDHDSGNGNGSHSTNGSGNDADDEHEDAGSDNVYFDYGHSQTMGAPIRQDPDMPSQTPQSKHWQTRLAGFRDRLSTSPPIRTRYRNRRLEDVNFERGARYWNTITVEKAVRLVDSANRSSPRRAGASHQVRDPSPLRRSLSPQDDV
ncbi:hypothetical protein SODALDRAFT_353824 [Sodiomyces alkalinus F11]|uniref:Uncharacterized protein n=1 Tax=Sodiomyces alkalinus (strain CBS 110278 / VKM F-3762 / F11) TaxID=1314773 RepID=A0A3N2PJ00_SODAK|nr:hypothetical protein SODALDRAFT_353824 [Sodiomyces alkalinus F11]ROT34518.1 hypothetical protein SODALDRAFT_353824 [Sodiomyces alkalinus F11]